MFFSSCNQQTEATKFAPNPKIIEKREVTPLPIGEVAPDFNLPGVDGKFHKLSEYDNSELLINVV